MEARSIRIAAALLAACGVAAPSAVLAGDWSLRGGLEAQVDNYQVSGDPAPSPYRYEGTFWRLRLDMNASYDNGRGRTATVRADVLGARDDYLADDGLVVQQFAVEIEDGSTRVPYRLGLGDVFANFSRRTIQRAIRGASFELQSRSGNQSILFVSGTGQPQWRDSFDASAGDLYFNGASYLWTGNAGHSSVVANLLHVSRGPLIPYPAPADRNQMVASVAGETQLGSIRFEGEAARLSEGHDGHADTALFGQLSHRGRTLAWRLRYDDTGAYFRPTGGVGLIADRRAGELHTRLRLGGAGQLSARAERFEDGIDGPDTRRDTTTVGLAYEGSPIASRPSMGVTATIDRSRFESKDHTLDQRFVSWGIEVRDRVAGSLTVLLGTRTSARTDFTNRPLDTDTTDLSFRLGDRIPLARSGGPVGLTVQAGVIRRRQTGPAAFISVTPTLDLGVASEHHSLELHLSFLKQDFGALTTSDLHYTTRGLRYSFIKGKNTFRIDAAQVLRRPDAAPKTDAARYSISYRRAFDGQ